VRHLCANGTIGRAVEAGAQRAGAEDVVVVEPARMAEDAVAR